MESGSTEWNWFSKLWEELFLNQDINLKVKATVDNWSFTFTPRALPGHPRSKHSQKPVFAICYKSLSPERLLFNVRQFQSIYWRPLDCVQLKFWELYSWVGRPKNVWGCLNLHPGQTDRAVPPPVKSCVQGTRKPDILRISLVWNLRADSWCH